MGLGDTSDTSNIVLVVRCRECKHWGQFASNRQVGICQVITDSALRRNVVSKAVPVMTGNFVTAANWYCPLGEKPDWLLEPLPAREEPVPAVA